MFSPFLFILPFLGEKIVYLFPPSNEEWKVRPLFLWCHSFPLWQCSSFFFHCIYSTVIGCVSFFLYPQTFSKYKLHSLLSFVVLVGGNYILLPNKQPRKQRGLIKISCSLMSKFKADGFLILNFRKIWEGTI